MSLKTYRAKRDFKTTPEPVAKVRSSKRAPIFVVQEHHASRLHWDFRLEADGVLKSWAVPKGPSMDPTVKRLAVHVEDHPLDYAGFHGDIPEGQYGAGHVEIWDKGTYENLMENKPRPMKLAQAVEAGHVEVALHGSKLKGAFALVRTQMGKGKENWLLIKMKDGFAKNGGAAKERTSATQEVTFKNLDKIMFPDKGYTKGDVLKFYADISAWLLPYLKDRSVTVERLPDGLRNGATRFWQKNTPEYYPEWIPRVDLPADGKSVNYSIVNDVQTLLYFVNQGALTFHVFFSRVKSLNRPDYVLFDLDPSEAKFSQVVEVAKKLHRVLEEQGVESFVKTSGKSGLHVLTAWKGARGGYDKARAWAVEIGKKLVKEASEIATMERSKASRNGRVYVDVMQNGLGRHVVPPYVLRAVPDATVSMPLDWKEVNGKLDPRKFDLKTAIRRIKSKGDLMQALLE